MGLALIAGNEALAPSPCTARLRQGSDPEGSLSSRLLSVKQGLTLVPVTGVVVMHLWGPWVLASARRDERRPWALLRISRWKGLALGLKGRGDRALGPVSVSLAAHGCGP